MDEDIDSELIKLQMTESWEKVNRLNVRIKI